MESYVGGLLVAMRKGPFWKGLPSLDLLMYATVYDNGPMIS